MLTHLYFDAGMNASDSAPKVSPCAAVALEIPTRSEARLSNHPCKVLLTGELPYRFYQILVGLAITSEDGSQERDDREGILVVEPMLCPRQSIKCASR